MKLTREVLSEIEVEAEREAKRVDSHGHASTWASRQYLALADAARVIDKMLAEKGDSIIKDRSVPSKEQSENWQETMDRLQATWQANYEEMKYLHQKPAGVRSTQIGALVMMLIKMGIIK